MLRTEGGKRKVRVLKYEILSVSTKKEEKRGAFMRMNFKPYVRVLAVVVGISIIGSTVRTMASPAMNAASQEQDYSKNKKYQQGVREGKDDKAHNRDDFR